MRADADAADSYDTCVACDCNGNGQTEPPMCDERSGVCLNCRVGTVGEHCEACAEHVESPACDVCEDEFYGISADGCSREYPIINIITTLYTYLLVRSEIQIAITILRGIAARPLARKV
jgi:hypothetical protein